MIHRNVEKALHLLGVQVHRQHAMHAGGSEQIGDQFRRDRDARLVFAVLARVSKKWNDGGDSIRAGAPCGVHHDQQLH